MNPWLQRFLISWAAGVAASGAIVSTAKRPGKLKRRKKKKADGTEEPVQLGAVALHDARVADERGITVREWGENVRATGAAVGQRVKGLFSRAPKEPVVAEDGARVPDEVQTKDGARIKTPRAKRKGAHAKGRRGKRRRRPQATLWDSAKESLKQTVKETVKEEVKATPVGSALEALKSVGAKVKEGASAAAGAVNKAIGGTAGEKASSADDEIPPQLRGEVPPTPEEIAAREEARLAEIAAQEAVRAEKMRKVEENIEKGLDAFGKKIEGAIAKVAEAASSAAQPREPREPPAPAEHVDGEAPPAPPVDPAEVAKKLKGGLDVVGSWLQGPGAPGYGSRRVRPANAEVVDAVDVVEAKDPDVVEAKDAPDDKPKEDPDKAAE